jgi:hypothetical protein
MSPAARQEDCCSPKKTLGRTQGQAGGAGEAQAEDECCRTKADWGCYTQAVGIVEDHTKGKARKVNCYLRVRASTFGGCILFVYKGTKEMQRVDTASGPPLLSFVCYGLRVLSRAHGGISFIAALQWLRAAPLRVKVGPALCTLPTVGSAGIISTCS